MKQIFLWLQTQFEQTDVGAVQLKADLATAVLFLEIIRADHRVDEVEVLLAERFLRDRYSLDEAALQSLLRLAQEHVEDAADLHAYTRLINQHLTHEDKRQLVHQLWQLAKSDGEVSPEEEHLIRRLSDLLHLSHSQFIQAKLAEPSPRE